MPASPARYKSYILRLWQEHEDAPWRARVEAIDQGGEVKHFADATALLNLLNHDVSQEEGNGKSQSKSTEP